MPPRTSPRHHPETFGAANARIVPKALHDDGRIAWILERQHGAASRSQLLAAGVSRHAIDRRLATGSLRAIHRGVFMLAGAPVIPHGRWAAALLASPPGSALSHRSAAELLGIVPVRDGAVHVTAPRTRARRPGLIAHTSPSVESTSVSRSRLLCTNVSRTLVDLAAVSSYESVRRAWTTAASRRLLRPKEIARELDAHPTRAGSAIVRRLLTEQGAIVDGRTRSDLEASCIRLCRDHRLPAPKVNARIRIDTAVFEADLAWPDAQLIAEIDTWRTHGHAEAFADDRARDFVLAAHGWRTVRLLEQAILERPKETADGLRRMLGRPLRAQGS